MAVNKKAVLKPGLFRSVVLKKQFVPEVISNGAAAQKPSVKLNYLCVIATNDKL